MVQKIIKISLLQLLIMILYLAITDYLFVVSKYPNPIGIGIYQWILFILHIIFTLVLTIYLAKRNSEKKHLKKRAELNVAIVSIFFLIYIASSNPVWNWLWHLRGQ